MRNDVKGIAGTEEFTTASICNEPVRGSGAKMVAEVEVELETDNDVSTDNPRPGRVVVAEIDDDRKDIAYNYLEVGQPTDDPMRLGPQPSYSRTKQLADIERDLADPGAFAGMERQRVTEALVAAKLSRVLESGGWDRMAMGVLPGAIRSAKKDGSYRLEIRNPVRSTSGRPCVVDGVLSLT